jgi:hypothetical protein
MKSHSQCSSIKNIIFDILEQLNGYLLSKDEEKFIFALESLQELTTDDEILNGWIDSISLVSLYVALQKAPERFSNFIFQSFLVKLEKISNWSELIIQLANDNTFLNMIFPFLAKWRPQSFISLFDQLKDQFNYSHFLFSFLKYYKDNDLLVYWIFIESLVNLLTITPFGNQISIANASSLLSSFQWNSKEIIAYADLLITFACKFPLDAINLLDQHIFPLNDIPINFFTD